MKTRFLIAGFSSLVLGLSLMMINYALRITGELPVDIIGKLTQMGAVVTGVGLIMVAIGLIRALKGNLGLENHLVMSTGANITALGISAIVAAIGHNQEEVIKISAWVATGIGGLLVAFYVYLSFRRVNT